MSIEAECPFHHTAGTGPSSQDWLRPGLIDLMFVKEPFRLGL